MEGKENWWMMNAERYDYDDDNDNDDDNDIEDYDGLC